MGLFSNNFNKPGPGIPKDAAKKTGAALFFEILGREFWGLLTLNLAYILACLPVVTIGPATAAISRVTVTMVRDQNVYVWRDFWDAFRKNLKQGILFGIPTTMFVAAALVIDYSLLVGILSGTAGVVQIALIILWTVLGVGLGCYIFPMIAYVALPSLPLLKNALLLMILGNWRSLLATGVSIAATTAAVLFFPLSTVIVLFCGYFSLLSFFTSFFIWPVIDKYVVQGVQLVEVTPDAEDDSDTESAK